MYLCLHTYIWEIDRWIGGVTWRQNLSIVMKSELSLKTTLLIYRSVYDTIRSFGSWQKELGCNYIYWPLKWASFAGWPECPLAKGWWEARSSRKTSESSQLRWLGQLDRMPHCVPFKVVPQHCVSTRPLLFSLNLLLAAATGSNSALNVKSSICLSDESAAGISSISLPDWFIRLTLPLQLSTHSNRGCSCC